MELMLDSPTCTYYSFAGEVAVSIWVVGKPNGYHEVFGTPGEPEIVSPPGDGNL